MNSLRGGTLVFLGAFALARAAAAQSDNLGPAVLRLPGSTRALGVGNAFAAGRGPEVLFYNPAQMFITRGSALSVQRLGSVSTLGTFTTVGALGTLAIGAGVQYLDYQSGNTGPALTPPSLLATPGPIGSAGISATVAAAIRWNTLRLGVGVKYLAEHIGPARDASVAVDVGVAREVGRMTVALVVSNLGPGLSMGGVEGDLPRRVTAGVASPSIRVGTFFDLLGTAVVSLERDGRIMPGGGGELQFEPVSGWTFAARAGVLRRDEYPFESTWAPTVGASFGLDRFALDYGFVPIRGPGASHRVGIRIQ